MQARYDFLFTYMNHLQAHKFEALSLKPLDDISNEAPLHSIGLDGNKGTLLILGHDSGNKAEGKKGLKTIKKKSVNCQKR